MRGLKNKHVLITGAASGIGKATALRFLEEGAHVVALDRDHEALDRLAAERPQISGFIEADVSEPIEIARAFAALDGLVDRLDVLINNAGISIRHDFVDITLEDWRKVMRVNLGGLFSVAQQVARRMIAREGGVILNMDAIYGFGTGTHGSRQRCMPWIHTNTVVDVSPHSGGRCTPETTGPT